MYKSFAAIAVALLAGGVAYAQLTTDPAAPRVQQSQQSAAQENAATQQHAPGQAIDQQRTANYRATATRQGQGSVHRLSEIMGLDVVNRQNEDLGDIEDVVIDVQSGKIRYAAISVGGFLGIGDKLIAVPWKSLNIQRTGDDDYQVVFNIDEARLRSAPGFNQDNWPDFANEQFGRQTHQFYGVEYEEETTSATGTRSSMQETRPGQRSSGTQGYQGSQGTTNPTDTETPSTGGATGTGTGSSR